MSGTIIVHLRVNDRATRSPTPVRISVSSPGPVHWAPLGYYPRFPTGLGEAVGAGVCDERTPPSFAIDGACEIRLPTQVPLEVTIHKGPAYEPVRETVTLGAGQISLRFEIAPREAFPAGEWLGGDARVELIDPWSAFLEAQAEGVQITQLLARTLDVPTQQGTLQRHSPNLAGFSGSKSCLESPQGLLAVNTLNTHPVLGRVALLHTHRPVFPLSFGDVDETDDWSVADWCDQCHRKTGLAVWVDPYRHDAALPVGEVLAAAILQKLDGYELTPRGRLAVVLGGYYTLLNAGVRLPVVGASGKNRNSIPLGAMRTWVRRGGGISLSHWVESIRRGNCVAATGLPVDLTVNGQPPGSVLRPHRAGEPLEVDARAYHPEQLPLQLLVNGEVVDEAPGRLQQSVTLPEGGWLAVRHLDSAGELLHTAPVYFEPEDRPRFALPRAIQSLQMQLDFTRQWVETQGRFSRDGSRAHLLEQLDAARAVLGRRSEALTE